MTDDEKLLAFFGILLAIGIVGAWIIMQIYGWYLRKKCPELAKTFGFMK